MTWVPSDGNTYPPPWFFGEFRLYPETFTFDTCLNSAVATPTKVIAVDLKTGETSESDWGSSTSAVCAATLTKSWPLSSDFNVNVSKQQFPLGQYGPGDNGELTIEGGAQTNPDPSTIPTSDTEG